MEQEKNFREDKPFVLLKLDQICNYTGSFINMLVGFGLIISWVVLNSDARFHSKF